ncbi:ASKHA domain-containing protein [Candidatus Binatia bacterium]|nr:ASKHA domain-containing protein [Candidatus Binatia bacterium]
MTHRRLRYDPARDGAIEDFLFDAGVEFPCGGTSLCGGCAIRVVAGEVPVTPGMSEALTEQEIADGWRLACRGVAGGPIELEVAQWSREILTDETAVPFEPRPGAGAAIDVGTTTLVAQRVDLASGEVTAVETALNEQARYGADLMSRIEHARREPGRLGEIIRSQLRAMLSGMGPLEEIVLVGNTAMHHLCCDLDVTPLSFVPFRSPTLGLRALPPAVLGAPAAFLPCIGGFVGSDLLAGIVATGMLDASEPTALLDLGTNGEIAVGDRHGIVCVSTAAGPAFEGGRIGRGMRAGHGAIDRVDVHDGRLVCHVIGGEQARGLCGSGVVDAVTGALALGWIDGSGRLAGGRGSIPLASDVALSQTDVRELQLAKGAVAAGLQLLLGDRVLRTDRVFLAGAFGNYVRAESARRIGLLPAWATAPVAAGNAALRGARMLLLAPSRRQQLLDRIAADVRHLELAADPRFEDAFVEAMRLKGG